MSNNNGNSGAFFVGFLIGGLIGSIAALILAPQSGEETRNSIGNQRTTLRNAGSNRVQQYRTNVGNQAQMYRDRANQTFTQTQERFQDGSGRVQEQARIVLDSGKQRADKMREQVSNLRGTTFSEASNGHEHVSNQQ